MTALESTEEFTERITAAIDGASLTLLLSIGHQTGLLDTMAGLAPATSTQIAEAAGLNERYVREWLAGMTTGRVVDYDPDAATYSLPAQRAAVLTRAAGPDNLALVTLLVPVLAEVEQKIIGCFRAGGGLPYSEFPRFHALMAEQSGVVYDTALVDVVLPLVDGLVQRLQSGADVADFGCGSGHAINVMAQAFPASRFTGIDFSEQAIATGVREAAERGLSNAAFESHNLAELDKAEAYDVITVFDAIHDQAQPAQVLRNIYRALRPGGVLLMADIKASSRLEENIGVPMSTYLYTTSLMHCMTVSLALDGAGLGTAWGTQLAVSMLGDAGFDDVRVAEIESDPINNYYIARK
ncbi:MULTISPECIES: class I SAM-dependent methyltransferase [Mycobacterium]|uniref:Methyltransferase n=1 Tax=Mycobacterium colombiense TaxID=339268 RepID=A0A329LRC0_9MYCO|nr:MULTISPECIES: class I SAM-dependent methyltransferase [Mycobacterium]MDM4142630.1 class I SAM-dependent methyltransferase [Mycobacterium sp. FLAC0960]RAV07267.1 methyltransferase [Mycobacterium colombiense]